MSQPTPKETLYFLAQIRKIQSILPHPIANLDTLIWKTMAPSILGKFSHLTPRCIFLNERYRITPEELVSTVAHELRHKWQYENMPMRYIMFCGLFMRGSKLEPSACRVEQAVYTWMGRDGIKDGDK